MANEKQKIQHPHLILCEGADAYYFLIHFLNRQLEAGEYQFNEFQVWDFGGNEQLKLFLNTMPNLPNYDMVKSITIVRDAELDFDSSVKSIQHSLVQAGYATPDLPCQITEQDDMKFSFALFPSLSDKKRNGTLEDLCLENLSEQNSGDIMNDVDCFFAKLGRERGRRFKHRHKSKLYTYLSITDDYVTLKLAEAANAGAYSFEGTELQSLKSLLLSISQPDSPIFLNPQK